VKDALMKQDSDTALTLITKGSLSLGGSDIHYDVKPTSVAVRLRIDGNLTTVFELTPAEYKLVLERLKYKSNMKLNLTRFHRTESTVSRMRVTVSMCVYPHFRSSLGRMWYVESLTPQTPFLR